MTPLPWFSLLRHCSAPGATTSHQHLKSDLHCSLCPNNWRIWAPQALRSHCVNWISSSSPLRHSFPVQKDDVALCEPNLPLCFCVDPERCSHYVGSSRLLHHPLLAQNADAGTAWAFVSPLLHCITLPLRFRPWNNVVTRDNCRSTTDLLDLPADGFSVLWSAIALIPCEKFWI